MSPVSWLRASYRIGALVDALAAVAMLVPAVGATLYGMSGFEPGDDYRYAMRLGASLMLGWSLLLLWADRKPVERRGVLPITVLVVAGLAWACGYAVSAELITPVRMAPTWVLQGALIALFLYSFFASRGAASEAALPKGQVTLERAAETFLAQERIAVAGVSRSGDSAANYVFKRLEQRGREVYAINPNAETVEGEPCFSSLASLPQPPNAVIIATHPDQAMDLARQCRDIGVRHVWFHRSIDGGSFDEEAVALCVDYGATVIPGGCPMMHLHPVDLPHRCMRFVLNGVGALPKGVEAPREASAG